MMLGNGWEFCGFHHPSEGLANVCTFQENKKNTHSQPPEKALTETPYKTTCNFSFDCVADVRGFLF